jgi:two-component system sensor histidine kinase YesM
MAETYPGEMVKKPVPTIPFKSLALNVFLLIIIFLLIPVYISFIVFRTSYEEYIQRELSGQIIGTIKKGENEVYETFQKMANISNMIALDRELGALLRDNGASYWDRNKRFDEVVNSLLTNNIFDRRDFRITMFDNQKRNYANWSLNFNDYSYIMDEAWVRDSISYKGHITWSLFAPSFTEVFAGGKNDYYISLARSILYPPYSGERLATLMVSINQWEIQAMLTRNDMNADFIRVCTEESGEEMFKAGNITMIKREDLRRLLEQTAGTGSGGRLCKIDGNRYLLSYYTLKAPWTINGQRLVVLYFTDYRRITDNLSILSRAITYRMVIFLIILVVIIAVISYTIARPIRVLEQKVNQFTHTRKIGVFNIRRRDEIGDLNRAFLDMEIRINGLFDKLREEIEIRERYHFKALRAQINPHFLFNTLNTIRWMAAIRKADNIVDTINALSRILDYTMGRTGELASLREELEMIQSYVHIQNYRYGEDMEVCVNIEKGLEEFRIVKFILQPIVENSFLHAFKNIRRKKTITITGTKEERNLKISVRDNGIGMTAQKLRELEKELEENNGEDNEEKHRGIGIINVHRRISAGYGKEFGLALESAPGEGTAVEFTLPLLKEEGR